MSLAIAFSLVCLMATAALVLAERLGRPVLRAVSKVAGSAAFVLVALALDATG